MVLTASRKGSDIRSCMNGSIADLYLPIAIISASISSFSNNPA